MSVEENQQKLAQFNEFFSIEHPFNVNITELTAVGTLGYDQFLSRIPLPFKMATDIVTLDQSALRPLQAISGVAGQLVEYLNHQSEKIDLLVGYILSQQDDVSQRFQGVKFGGGGIVFQADKAFELNQLLELKLFFLEENCAVFCHGEVISIESDEQQFLHKIIFHHIREEDREILVRTSLHQQSKQLQRLAKARDQAAKNQTD
ncbi:PilZ domain-containing protein [Thalassotalea sp. PLHSN55]|uniref:PilZ domain-containing protein n=1 Tax=Thalassotalea sp. PLHSN55 TaxID=3435888 RepID=UPI003F85549F